MRRLYIYLMHFRKCPLMKTLIGFVISISANEKTSHNYRSANGRKIIYLLSGRLTFILQLFQGSRILFHRYFRLFESRLQNTECQDTNKQVGVSSDRTITLTNTVLTGSLLLQLIQSRTGAALKDFSRKNMTSWNCSRQFV